MGNVSKSVACFSLAVLSIFTTVNVEARSARPAVDSREFVYLGQEVQQIPIRNFQTSNGLEICNENLNEVIWISVAEGTSGKWITKGWELILPGTCDTVSNFIRGQKSVYLTTLQSDFSAGANRIVLGCVSSNFRKQRIFLSLIHISEPTRPY